MHWSGGLGDAPADVLHDEARGNSDRRALGRGKASQDVSREEDFGDNPGFSFIVNVINSRIFAALDMKYKSGMMQIKNNADVDALRKIVENFVETPHQTSKAAQEQKEKGTVSPSVPVLRNQQEHRKRLS